MGRFLFDECIGKPVMESIRQLVQSAAAFAHICDYLNQGVLDAEWVPRIAADGGWVVITADGGKQSKRGNKLPDLCRHYGITHVVLSAKLHGLKSREKAAAVAALRAEIEKLSDEPAGSRFRLRYKEVKGRVGMTIVLEKVEYKPPPPAEDVTTGDSEPNSAES